MLIKASTVRCLGVLSNYNNSEAAVTCLVHDWLIFASLILVSLKARLTLPVNVALNARQMCLPYWCQDWNSVSQKSSFIVSFISRAIAWRYLPAVKSIWDHWLPLSFAGEGPCLATYFVRHYWQLLVLRVLTGISVGGTLPLIYSLVGDLFDVGKRAPVAAAIQVATGIGLAAGQAISGFVGELHNAIVP